MADYRLPQSYNDDLNSTIQLMHQLQLESVLPDNLSGGAAGDVAGSVAAPAESPSTRFPRNDDISSVGGKDWPWLFVSELAGSSDYDDAVSRASKGLDLYRKSIVARSAEETKILKRAVVVQYERSTRTNNELGQLKHMISQFQDQVKSLELANYALKMQLIQAQLSSNANSVNPHIF